MSAKLKGDAMKWKWFKTNEGDLIRLDQVVWISAIAKDYVDDNYIFSIEFSGGGELKFSDAKEDSVSRVYNELIIELGIK
jgi:hypothetical protein